jgi:hypothetical protein
MQKNIRIFIVVLSSIALLANLVVITYLYVDSLICIVAFPILLMIPFGAAIALNVILKKDMSRLKTSLFILLIVFVVILLQLVTFPSNKIPLVQLYESCSVFIGYPDNIIYEDIYKNDNMTYKNAAAIIKYRKELPDSLLRIDITERATFNIKETYWVEKRKDNLKYYPDNIELIKDFNNTIIIFSENSVYSGKYVLSQRYEPLFNLYKYNAWTHMQLQGENWLLFRAYDFSFDRKSELFTAILKTLKRVE